MLNVAPKMAGLLLAGTVLLAPRLAAAIDIPTVYDNMHMYPVGSRAAGMGGAYTALACDEAALHYNPAALGCAGSSRLELAASAYVVQGFSVPNAFGEGQDINALTYSAVPSIVGGVRVLRDPDDAFGSGRVVFGFNVSLPQSLVLNVEPTQESKPNYIAFQVRDQITTADAGVGWQINRYVAIGASLGGALRTYEGRIESLFTDDFTQPCLQPEGCRSFAVNSTAEEAFAIGLRGKAGLRVTPTPDLSLGLAVTSPTIDVYGTADLVDSGAYAISDLAGGVAYDPTPARLEGRSNASLPLRMALGFAYRWPGLTLSLDASVNFPHTAETGVDFEQTVFDGIAPLTDEDIEASELVSEHNWQPNVNLGAEIGIVEDVVIDLGAFTDISSVTSEAVEDGADRVHMFGGTAALGLLGEQTRGWFGLSFEYGRSTAQVFEGELNLESVLFDGLELSGRSTLTRWTLGGFIGSNYSFAGDGGDDEDGEE